jgi:butyryl-CoA dehydrogenase
MASLASMDFAFCREQGMVRDTVKRFAEREVRPIAKELDELEDFPWPTLKKMWDVGLMGMTVPKEFGGTGSDYVSYAAAIEEISKASASVGVIMAVHNSVCAYPIVKYGTDGQKAKYLTRLAREGWLGAFALTEPSAGSDASAVQTTASLNGDNYILNGNKVFITSGTEAHLIIVVASTDRAKGSKGLTAFLVEKGMPGFTYGTTEEKMGMRGSATSELVFENCIVPKENVLGADGEGLKIALSSLDGGRIGIAAQALGIAQAALDEAVKYAKEREQFGKPIGKLQAIQWKLADMAVSVEAARALVYRAAWLKDAGLPLGKEAAMAKLYASKVAREVTNEAVQIHGGYGYTRDYEVERYYRDAKVTEIYEGTSEIQKLVIANALLK